MIPGVWYTESPISNNPPVCEETKFYGSSPLANKPQVFCPLALAFLLSYLGAYFFLGHFNPLLGRYQLLGELFHLGMVSLPVGSLVMGLNPSAIIHHLGGLLPRGWVPDTVQGLVKCKQDKVLHHDCLRPCKARQKQRKTVLPTTEQQLVHYSAWAPDNLPDNLPPEEADLQPGGVKTAGLTCQQGSE
ncbi:hypothetical protein DSO57_1024015 [Entomophthora muscae]|uniref:Uncharacterized protein n=1 Tax=Entomophthora muscae TaxID=34485 RepID=A0ACC2SRX5_9FUNG|nr:hypothetical protein DSO57_1024015 [Entomophthora muscae]